ncbi:MAG: hypothetical protein KDD55_11730 [Bdellovibrionales bacterium]|nr:hypothetical protein [Bdellovibrionales bacterium]
MINLIGAYIVTIFLVGLVSKRPSLARGEAELTRIPLVAHGILLFLLFFLFIDVAFPQTVSFWPLQILTTLVTGATLWIHEAGHIYWGWDGEFLHSFGGTLNEILFSLVPALYCYRKRYVLFSALFLFWFGHLSFGISHYMGDARAQVLPLLGNGTHDWLVVLGKLSLLQYDTMLSKWVWWIGVLVSLLSLFSYARHIFELNQSNRNGPSEISKRSK